MYQGVSRGKYLLNLLSTNDYQSSTKVIVLPSFGDNEDTKTQDAVNQGMVEKRSDFNKDNNDSDDFDGNSIDNPNWIPSEEETADQEEEVCGDNNIAIADDEEGRIPVGLKDNKQGDDSGDDSITIQNEEEVGIGVGLEDNKQEGNGDAGEDKENGKVHSRKRKRNVEEWVRSKKRQNVNTGRTYKTKSNKVIPARVLKKGCGNKCRLKCSDKFNGEERLKLNENYWNMGDIVKQREFVTRHMSEVNPKYRQSTQNKHGNTRSLNMAYHLTKAGDIRVRVCKKYFKNTLCITDRMIRTTISKLQAGFMIQDFRGKHGRQRKLDPNVTERIRQHIKSFPRIESHYLRNQTTREFIEGSLNIATMHRLYVEDSKLKNLPCAKISSYERIFNYEFNIGFFKPKKDLCAFCESYINANDQEKAELGEKKKVHDTEKLLSRESKEKDKQLAKGGFVKAACFDLEAILPTPCGEISDFYYKSKLSTFNLSFADLASGHGYCYMWNENIGRRGANEVGTCILDYLATVCEGNGDIIFYSDNCTGQNKNKYLVALYSYAVQKYNINSIIHKYLIVGHTQNEVDGIHSIIEEKKRTLKSGPISVPEQWIQLVRTAKKSGKPYTVKEMCTEDFIDVKDLQQRSGLTNFGTGVWKDIKEIKISKQSPTVLQYKTSFADEMFKTLEMKRTSSTRGRHPSKYSLSTPNNAYNAAPGRKRRMAY